MKKVINPKLSNIIKLVAINIVFILIILIIIDFSIYTKYKNDFLKNLDPNLSDLYHTISYIENYKADFEPLSHMFQKITKQILIILD